MSESGPPPLVPWRRQERSPLLDKSPEELEELGRHDIAACKRRELDAERRQLAEAEQNNALRCQRAETGEWLCADCNAVKLAPAQALYCADCKKKRREAAASEQQRQQRENAVRKLDGEFRDYASGGRYSGGLTHPPAWEHARFDNPEFRRRASRKIVAAVERWSPERGSLLLSAFTGAGKTAAVLAWLYRMRDAAFAKARAGEDAKIVPFAFITGHELANCRRRWSIGEESPLVKLATSVDVLVLDELGFEPMAEELFEVIDHRYRARRSTVITTGRTVEWFKGNYGDALFRRLIEPGTVVEDQR
jgi:DNA replication protein DnaC